MRYLTLVLLFVLSALIGTAQTWYNVYPGDVPLVDIDNYDGGIAANISPVNEPHLFSVNTTDTSNAWVYGTSTKPYFDNEMGWVTDSVNAYADSLRSELVVMIPSPDGVYQTSWIAFEHKYATDTLLDGGYMEYSCDSVNWDLVKYHFWTGEEDAPTEVRVLNFPSVVHDTVPGFTGTQAEWEWSAVQIFWYFPVFQGGQTRSSGCTWEELDTIYVRFVFESDDVQTNKDGWMIRNMIIGLDNFPGAIDDYVKSPIEVYPNPAADIVRFRVPDGIEEPTTITVFDMAGRHVLQTPFVQQIDVSSLSVGSHMLVLQTENHLYRQLLIVE